MYISKVVKIFQSTGSTTANEKNKLNYIQDESTSDCMKKSTVDMKDLLHLASNIKI